MRALRSARMVALAAIVSLGVAACGGGGEEPPTESSAEVMSIDETSSAEETGEEETSPEAQETSSEPAETESPSVNPDITYVELEWLREGLCGLRSAVIQSEAVTTFPEIDCEKPHDSEIFAIGNIESDDEYPGEEQVADLATTLCYPFFEQYVGIPANESSLGLYHIHPSADTWRAGDRKVICILASESPTLTESMKGAER